MAYREFWELAGGDIWRLFLCAGLWEPAGSFGKSGK